MKNLIILIAIVLFGCTQAEQSKIYDMPEIDSTNYRNFPWWPGFESMVLPNVDGMVILSVEETEEGYTVKYKGNSILGEYFMPCQ